MSDKDLTQQEDTDEFTPPPGSGAVQFINVIPESDKVDNYDYDKLKLETLKENTVSSKTGMNTK